MQLLRQTAVADVAGDATFTSPAGIQAVVLRVESPNANKATSVDFQFGTPQVNNITNQAADVSVSFAPGALGLTTIVRCPAGAAGETIALTWGYNN